MATDFEIVVERAYYRVEPMVSSAKQRINRFEIESMVQNALNRLADRIAEGPDYQILQKTFNIAQDATTGTYLCPSDMIVRTIVPHGNVKPTGDIFSAAFLPDVQDLEMGGRPTDWKYYTVRSHSSSASGGGGAILLYKGDGSVANVANIDVRANYYPSTSGGAFTGLPTQLQDDLVDILVAMCEEKMGALNATPTAPGGAR